MSVTEATPPTQTVAPKPKQLNAFERYLTVWVALCMVIGVFLGRIAPGLVESLRGLEFGKDSQINVPIAVLIGQRHFPSFNDGSPVLKTV